MLYLLTNLRYKLLSFCPLLVFQPERFILMLKKISYVSADKFQSLKSKEWILTLDPLSLTSIILSFFFSSVFLEGALVFFGGIITNEHLISRSPVKIHIGRLVWDKFSNRMYHYQYSYQNIREKKQSYTVSVSLRNKT